MRAINCATGSESRHLAGLARLVVQRPVDTGFRERRCRRAGLRDAGPAHDLRRAAALGRGRDDLRSPDMLLRTVAVDYHSLKRLPIPPCKPDFNVLRIQGCCHRARPEGIFCFNQTTSRMYTRLPPENTVIGALQLTIPDVYAAGNYK